MPRGALRKELIAALSKTLTYDQGREMARHETLAQRLRIEVFFADPHSPWQRPTNENTNSLVRANTCPRAWTCR